MQRNSAATAIERFRCCRAPTENLLDERKQTTGSMRDRLHIRRTACPAVAPATASRRLQQTRHALVRPAQAATNTVLKALSFSCTGSARTLPAGARASRLKLSEPSAAPGTHSRWEKVWTLRVAAALAADVMQRFRACPDHGVAIDAAAPCRNTATPPMRTAHPNRCAGSPGRATPACPRAAHCRHGPPT